jgi:hypothetical protein
MHTTEHDTTTVRQLNDERPDLRLITDTIDVNFILDHIGVDHDPDSIRMADSYGSLFVKGYYDEVWGMHQRIPYFEHTAYRLL